MRRLEFTIVSDYEDSSSRECLLGDSCSNYSLMSITILSEDDSTYIDRVGIVVMFALALPALVTTNCVPAFLITALCGIILSRLRRKRPIHFRELNFSTLSGGMPLAAILGGWLASVLTLILENYAGFLALIGDPFFLWWGLWILITISLFSLQGLRKKRRDEQV